jgi:alpha-glucosidase
LIGNLWVSEALQIHPPGVKLILDFVPNHTSNESIWFQKSEAGDEYYKDFYVWHPGKVNNDTGEREPPSNWNSLFRFSAWQWSEKRQEYYLHQCIVQQPDLNYRNPNVVNEMKKVLLFWLDKGIDGFRVDAIPYIFETKPNADGSYPDEPPSGLTNDTTSIDYTNRQYTKNLQETYDLVYDWRELVDQYKKDHGGDTRILMTEAYTTLEHEIQFYGNSFGRRGAEIPFNFEMINNINLNSTPYDYKTQIDNWMENMPKEPDYVPNWVVGNHDNHRVVNRFGINRGDAINMMVQMLPGIAITYYGEELVMADQWISYANTIDILACQQGKDNYEKLSRDPARTPMQWDDSKEAGFSTASSTWLPVADNYKSVNVRKERLDLNSHLNVFKRLTLMRKTRAVLQDGNLETVADRNLLIIKREIPGTQLFVILNFGTADQSIRLTDYFGTYKRLVLASVVSDNSKIRRG